MTTHSKDRATSLGIALAASLVLLVGSFARTWGDAGSAAFGGRIIGASLSQPLWGTALGWNLAAFVGALVLVHSLLGLLAWTLGHLTSVAFPASHHRLRTWTMLWFVALTIWIFMANAAWFPLSSLGRPYAGAVQASLFGVSAFDVATLSLLAGAGLTIARAVARGLAQLRARARWVFGVVTAVVVAGAMSFSLPGRSHAPGERQKPHIIFIGLDSLRADVVGRDHANLTPAINRFLEGATVFSDTLTPLARTFPAWVSIVSGRHPHTTGAVMNLLPRDLIDEGDTLPALLRDAGYRTVYATDEVRFSNLDESYGFDEMIAPPMGSADFLLGFFADAPLANLIVNTRAGKYLFPYAYANRAAAVTYEPETFVDRLAAELALDRPTFFAVHLTLAHWPYTWASAREHRSGDRPADTRDDYNGALPRLDQQFGEILDLLQRRGALDSAVVVVLSDHGESLGEAPTVPSYDAAKPGFEMEIYGHGTNVFAASQYRVLLAMRSFGKTPMPTPAGQTITVPASLVDLAPTLAEAFGLQPKRPFDGLSLLSALRGATPSATDLDRIRFMETEFNPPGLAPGDIMKESALLGGAKYYEIDPKTDRVLVRPQYLGQILNNREYAAFRAGNLLASVPFTDRETQRLVFVAAGGAEAAWLSEPPNAVANPVAFELWTALSGRFRNVRERPMIPPPPLSR